MKKSALLSALSIGVLSISMAFATPAQAVSQVRSNATEVLNILQKANGSNDAAVRRQAETYAMPYFDFQRADRSGRGQSVAPSHRCAKAGAHQRISNPADPHLFGHYVEI